MAKKKVDKKKGPKGKKARAAATRAGTVRRCMEVSSILWTVAQHGRCAGRIAAPPAFDRLSVHAVGKEEVFDGWAQGRRSLRA